MAHTSFNALFAAAEKTVEFVADAGAIDFCTALGKLMKKRGISQAELARRAGVSGAYISKVFRGDENLTLETMAKLALAVDGKIEIEVRAREEATVAVGLFGRAPVGIFPNFRAFEKNQAILEAANGNIEALEMAA